MRWPEAAMSALALMTRKLCSDQERWEVCNGPQKDPEECRKCGG